MSLVVLPPSLTLSPLPSLPPPLPPAPPSSSLPPPPSLLLPPSSPFPPPPSPLPLLCADGAVGCGRRRAGLKHSAAQCLVTDGTQDHSSRCTSLPQVPCEGQVALRSGKEIIWPYTECVVQQTLIAIRASLLTWLYEYIVPRALLYAFSSYSHKGYMGLVLASFWSCDRS